MYVHTCASEEARGEERDDWEGGEKRGIAEVGEDSCQHQQERETINDPQTNMHPHHQLWRI